MESYSIFTLFYYWEYMHMYVQCDAAQNCQECSQPLEGPKTSQPESCSVLQVHKNGQCADVISWFNTHSTLNAQLFWSLINAQNGRIFFFSVQPFWGIRNSYAYDCKSLNEEQNERAWFIAEGSEQGLESMCAPTMAQTWQWGSWKQGYSVQGAQGLSHFPSPLRCSAQIARSVPWLTE